MNIIGSIHDIFFFKFYKINRKAVSCLLQKLPLKELFAIKSLMEIPNAFYNLDLTPSDFRLFLIVIDYIDLLI